MADVPPPPPSPLKFESICGPLKVERTTLICTALILVWPRTWELNETLIQTWSLNSHTTPIQHSSSFDSGVMLLPPPQNISKVWPSSVSENFVQVAWQYRFPDPVSADCSAIIIAACRNFKKSCDINCYWQHGIVLGVGHVVVRISREGDNLDVIGRSEVTNGSKQALNMTWYVLAQFLYVIETHLSNYLGMCPEVSDVIFIMHGLYRAWKVCKFEDCFSGLPGIVSKIIPGSVKIRIFWVQLTHHISPLRV